MCVIPAPPTDADDGSGWWSTAGRQRWQRREGEQVTVLIDDASKWGTPGDRHRRSPCLHQADGWERLSPEDLHAAAGARRRRRGGPPVHAVDQQGPTVANPGESPCHLSPGHYTTKITAHDLAGNWSKAATAKLLVK